MQWAGEHLIISSRIGQREKTASNSINTGVLPLIQTWEKDQQGSLVGGRVGEK